MILSTKNLKDLFESKKLEASSLLSVEGFGIEYYHIFKGNSLHINITDEDTSSQLIYLVLEGSVEILSNKESKEFHQYDLIVINGDETFDIYAKSEVKLLFISNTNTVVNKKYDDLTKEIKLLEEKDEYLKGHNNRVSKYSIQILRYLKPNENTDIINFAANFHDIGKIKIKSSILNKKGSLTDLEFNEIKKHPIYSYEILKDALGEEIAYIAKCHHEKLDGTGYPSGLTKDEIPYYSQIITVADIYDALTTNRSYRDAYNKEDALKIMNYEMNLGKINKEAFNALKDLVKNNLI